MRLIGIVVWSYKIKNDPVRRRAVPDRPDRRGLEELSEMVLENVGEVQSYFRSPQPTLDIK